MTADRIPKALSAGLWLPVDTMLSHENIPASASKRAPPLSLNVKTGSRNASYDDPSPRTPPSHNRHAGRSKGASKAALRETFLDDITPVDKVRGDGKDKDDQDERDLHDLSLSPRHVTRDSVVDNMLLSLDQFSTRDHGTSNANDGGFYSTFDDDDPYTVNSRYASSKGGARHRGHKYSSSYSSEHDTYADDTSSRYSSHYSRGRRSNSSSNFQSALPRIDSVRAEKEASNPRGKSFGAQRAAVPGERVLMTHSRGGRKGSKSSGSSSLDFGQMISGSRWQESIHRRSNSFDHGYTKGGSSLPQPKFSTSTHVTDGRGQPLEYDFEAAPTPTVPVGPRKSHSSPPDAVFPPQPTHAPPQTPLVIANNSNQPSKYTYNRKGRSEKPATTSIRDKRANNTTGDRGMASVLPGPNPSAPSPTVNYHKPSVASTQGSMPQAKERPGFLRRVFGSSKNTTPTQNHLRPPQLPPMDLPSSRDTERSESRGCHASPLTAHAKLSKPLPARNPPAGPPKDNVQQTLNKKPSLFFRRRKKSVSGIDSPAVLPLHMQAKAGDANANPMVERSPVSSLRKVMNPYLHSPVTSPQEFHDSIEQQESDSGEKDRDHNPGGDAGHACSSTNPPRSRIRDEDEKVTPSPGHGFASAGRESPSASGKANLDVRRRDGHDDSFLQDSSSNDGRSGRTSPINRSPTLKCRDENRRPKTTPGTSTITREVQGENQRLQTLDPAAVKDVKAEGTRATLKPLSPATQNVPARSPSPKAAAGTADDEEWIVTPSKLREDQASTRNSSGKSSRVWLQPTTSEEQLRESSKLSLPLEGTKDSTRASGSSTSDYKSAKSLPFVQVNDKDTSKDLPEQAVKKGILLDQNVPTTEDCEQARKVYDGDEEFVSKAKAAAWLGESSPERARVRKAYMELFEWADLNILYALRGFCSKVTLKGETQQVDRILDAFSTRWCECNPVHGFKATGKPAISQQEAFC